MDWLRHHLLTILIFLPLVGAGVMLAVGRRERVRWVALGTTLVTFVVSLLLLLTFDWHRRGPGYADGVQMVQVANWVPAFNIQYTVGLDGLSLPFVLLTTFVSVIAAVASWNVGRMTRAYFALFLVLETAILGTFLSLDFVLFYVFFEASVLPMYFLIGAWGGPRRERAAIKFFLYALLGSIGLLIVVVGTYHFTRSFDLMALPALIRARMAEPSSGLTIGVARTFFLLGMLAFLIRLAAAPFHSWLADALVEAPTPCSMMLAALLLTLGGYGMFRVAYPLFPDAGKSLWLLIAIIGVGGMIYGALCAMGQTDFTRLVAYSSVSHVGFVVLGAAVMTPAGVNGAMFMMIADGITSAMMFFVVGVIDDRAHHRELSRLGGVATAMPWYWGLSAVAFFANMGLPGLCGFVGEVLVLLGSFQAARGDSIVRHAGATAGQGLVLAIVACFGVVLNAAYMLWAMQRVFFGPQRPEYKGFAEIDAREITVLAPLAVMAILLGVVPTAMVFALTDQAVAGWFASFR